MAKGQKRQKAESDKIERKKKRMESGGKSKYAQKRLLNAKGRFKKTSPFYVSPAQEAAARAIGSTLVDQNGKPIAPYVPTYRLPTQPAASLPTANVDLTNSP